MNKEMCKRKQKLLNSQETPTKNQNGGQEKRSWTNYFGLISNWTV